MKELRITEFFIEDVVKVLIDFLRKQNVEKVKFNWFDLSIDDNNTVELSLDALGERMIDCYNDDQDEFDFAIEGFEVLYLGDFLITYDEKFEKDMEVLRNIK